MSKMCPTCGGLVSAANEVLGYGGPLCPGTHAATPVTTPHSETDELEEVLAIALTIAFTRGKVAERNKHSERPYTITAEERGQAKAAIERIIQRRVVEEATRAREVAFNHRMDSGHDVALVLAARVKGLEAQLTQIK